jgi:methylamine---glutamate N-methyltransferase subunit B
LAISIDCHGKTTREINRHIRQAVAVGEREIRISHPEARHNLGVALLQPVHLIFEGSVGYYCAGMIDGANIEIHGSAGWGTAESMMNGTVIIDGNAGSGVAASIRGGTVAVRGDAAARAGVSMKGGTLLIGGNCGYMAGFMMQKGKIVVCGDAGDALADSMYEGVVFVGGRITSLGNDTVVEEPNSDDEVWLASLLHEYNVRGPTRFKKVVSGKKLWNFDRKELGVWKAAL